jgi:hypothetical protein
MGNLRLGLCWPVQYCNFPVLLLFILVTQCRNACIFWCTIGFLSCVSLSVTWLLVTVFTSLFLKGLCGNENVFILSCFILTIRFAVQDKPSYWLPGISVVWELGCLIERCWGCILNIVFCHFRSKIIVRIFHKFSGLVNEILIYGRYKKCY